MGCSHKAVRVSRLVSLCREPSKEVRLRRELEQVRGMTEPPVLLFFFILVHRIHCILTSTTVE